MKTSVIRYRVADFLREYPPFDMISMEDLLAFCGSGRVAFHEDDIFLFRKGQAQESKLWVVQQGKIEMLDETPAGEQLRDVLGPGDLLGLRRDASDDVYQYTARTATEVILYSFDLSAFETLAGKYPESERFLTAHISAAARHTKALQIPLTRERLLTEKEKTVWLNAPVPSADWIARRLITCNARLPISQAAMQMFLSKGDSIAVVAENGNPLGLITDREILDQFATGQASADVTVESLMNKRFPIAPKGLRVADYLLEMLRSRSQRLAITDSGLAESFLRGIIKDSDLEVLCGRNPVLLLREMVASETVDELALLWQRVEAFLSESLAGPTVIEWLSQMLSEFISVLIERSVKIATEEMARAGKSNPGLTHCWLLFGSAGRSESLASMVPEIGLVYLDPPASKAEAAENYFSTLIHKVVAVLESCGLQPVQTRNEADRFQHCHTFAEWREFYRSRIRDPIGNQIYTAREYLDFRVVSGEAELAVELQQVIAEELERSEILIPVLANDTIASVPPLTFYQGFALEADGRLNKSLDVEKNALKPITDAARVVAYAGKDIQTLNTLQRLRQAAKAFPQFASILTDAAEAWRIICYHHTLAGLSKQGNDKLINPARLSRFEQRMLKTAFDSTRRFLEFVSSIYDLQIPQ